MKKLALVVAAVALAGCNPPPPPPVAAAPQPVGPPHGIDMARDARDYSQELKGAKFDFVARYYRDPASRFPTLSAEEARSVSSSGMKLVTVWEWHSHKADYFSYATGYSDGMSAYRQAKGIGQPAGSAIYFAVDYNAPQSDIAGSIDQYFRGVAAGMTAAAGKAPEYRVGVYGSGAVCDYLKRSHLAQYAWLSNASSWEGYDNFHDWDIRQSGQSSLLTFESDENEAKDDYGGFSVPTTFSSL